MKSEDIGKSLSWDDLANIYDKDHSRKARTLPMDAIFEWAERQTNRFYVDEDEGTIHIIKGKE